MKPQELSVGNKIWRPCCYDEVVEIRKNGIIGLDNMRGIISFNELKPIPLTKEMLELNGFTKWINETYEICIDKFHFYIALGCGYFWEDNNAFDLDGILSVHQLQHALRLVGLNELADNWKV